MKYNIHGFHQPRAVELKLTNDDLLVLRWFVDFAGTKKMKTIIEEDGIYYWVNYTTVLEDLPVLRISKQTLKKKHFDNLCNANVLKHKHIKDGGSFSYYAYGINYDTLIYLQDDTPTSEFTKGYVEIEQTPTSEFTKGVGKNLPNKDNTINNYSINNHSINDNKEKEKEKDKKEKTKEKFEIFWKEYPKKISRAKALTWFEKNCPDDITFNLMLNKLKKFKQTTQWQKDKGQFIPYATTWLNQKRWEDELDVVEEENYYHEDGCIQLGRRRN